MWILMYMYFCVHYVHISVGFMYWTRILRCQGMWIDQLLNYKTKVREVFIVYYKVCMVFSPQKKEGQGGEIQHLIACVCTDYLWRDFQESCSQGKWTRRLKYQVWKGDSSSLLNILPDANTNFKIPYFKMFNINFILLSSF